MTGAVIATKIQKEAFAWIVGILRKHDVPFQVTGGLAARAYGSKRRLNDIDLEIPDNRFQDILQEVKSYITRGPARDIYFCWDTYGMSLVYKGQEIDITGANSVKLLNKNTGEWEMLDTDLREACQKEIFGLKVPVEPVESLVEYKSKIGEQKWKHQEDIKAIRKAIR